MNSNERAQILLSVYRSIESELGFTVAGNKDGITRPDGTYIMVPFNPVSFARVIELARDFIDARGWRSRLSCPQFVDVGAGLGFKTKIAKQFGFGATGIEYDKHYVDFAKKYLGIDLVHKNALDVNYKEFDVIYFYRPIADETMQRKLENRILSTMSDDALVIGVYSTRSFHDKIEEIGDEIGFKKGKGRKYFHGPKFDAIVKKLKEAV